MGELSDDGNRGELPIQRGDLLFARGSCRVLLALLAEKRKDRRLR